MKQTKEHMGKYPKFSVMSISRSVRFFARCLAQGLRFRQADFSPACPGSLPGREFLGRLFLCRVCFLFLGALCLCGCGASQPPAPAAQSEDPAQVLWPYAEKAITVQVSADRDLNLFDQKAHSLQFCVYQLASPEAFLDLAATQEGINRLLKADAFDPSVKSVCRMFIQPLEDNVFHLDRADGAHFVGIVCGYFDSTPENCAQVWEIPLQSESSGYLFWETTTYSAGTLALDLRLTGQAMRDKNAQGAD